MSTDDTSAAANGTHSTALCSTADEFLQHSFDYVIAGGGTAGLVLAARLSEDPNVHVGVLEAGKSHLDDPFVNIPALFTQMLSKPDWDWMYQSVPQAGTRGKVHALPRGKMLGGSSGINYMLYSRGSDADWDDWAELVGDKSWGAKELKKYFQKHETLEPLDEGIEDKTLLPWDPQYHGTEGPIHTTFNNSHMPFEHDFLRACDHLAGKKGAPKDPWSGDHIGFYSTLGTVSSGNRSYSASGYLAPNLGRPNLKVLTEATVSRIVLEGDKALGVKFLHDGKTHLVPTKREVLLSCGVIASPQLLELSGIGDPKILEAAGVECKIDLPAVGANYQDHSLGILQWRLAHGIDSLDALKDEGYLAQAQKIYGETQKGVLSGVTSAMGFLPYSTLVSKSELEQTISLIQKTPGQTAFQKQQHDQVIRHLSSPISANIQIVLIPVSLNISDEGLADQSILTAPRATPYDTQGTFVSCNVQYPAARGTVHITSSDATKPPAIDPALMNHPADVAVAVAAVRFMDKVAKSDLLKDKILEREYPSQEINLDDDDAAADYVQELNASEYHPVGSCAMGQVVDTELRVKGVRNLRVIDASVFPNHVSGNIVSSVYAVAEKAADIIKAGSR